MLGTTTLADTVDAALTEVIKLSHRRQLMELLFSPNALASGDSATMTDAWR
ncbi:MAG TPA: hypothetical protein VIS95_07655 [Solirubrobacterales bacterium]